MTALRRQPIQPRAFPDHRARDASCGVPVARARISTHFAVLERHWRPLTIIILGLAVRVWGLQTQSLSMDELADTLSAKGSASGIVHTVDGFPPLFGLLYHGWFAAFPHDDRARWFSVIVGVLTLLPMWRLGARVYGERVGFVAGLALALSPFHVGVSQEARAYALYLLFAVLALWFFTRAMDTNRAADWGAYALACTAGVYTHYYFALLPLTAGLLLVIEKWRSREMVPGLVAHAALAAAGLSLIPILRVDLAYQAGYPHDAPFNAVTLAYAYFSLIAGFNLGPSLRELHTLAPGAAIREVLPWALIAAGATSALAWFAWTELRRTPAGRRTALRLLVLVTVPVLIGGIMAEVAHVGFRVRYLAWVLVPLLLIAAIGACASRAIWPRIAAGALAVVWVVALVNRRQIDRYWNEDAAALARFLHENGRPADPVFVMSDYMAIPVAYYLGSGWRVCPLPNVGTESGAALPPVRVMRTMTRADSGFWLVYSRPFHSDVSGRVPRALEDAGILSDSTQFAGITLYRGRAFPRTEQFSPLACQNVIPALSAVIAAPGRAASSR